MKSGSQDESLRIIQKELGYEFTNIELLVEALSQKSVLGNTYCRLATLGDSIIGAIVLSKLFGEFPSADAGQLSSARDSLVGKDYLSQLGMRFNIANHLIVGKGHNVTMTGRMSSEIVEAIIGAIYVDSTFDICTTCVLAWYKEFDWSRAFNFGVSHPKSELQEFCSKSGFTVPIYVKERAAGAHNNTQFQVSCEFFDGNDKHTTTAIGSKIKDVETTCARMMLQKFGFRELPEADYAKPRPAVPNLNPKVVLLEWLARKSLPQCKFTYKQWETEWECCCEFRTVWKEETQAVIELPRPIEARAVSPPLGGSHFSRLMQVPDSPNAGRVSPPGSLPVPSFTPTPASAPAPAPAFAPTSASKPSPTAVDINLLRMAFNLKLDAKPEEKKEEKEKKKKEVQVKCYNGVISNITNGRGSSKKRAEQGASQQMYEYLLSVEEKLPHLEGTKSPPNPLVLAP